MKNTISPGKASTCIRNFVRKIYNERYAVLKLNSLKRIFQKHDATVENISKSNTIESKSNTIKSNSEKYINNIWSHNVLSQCITDNSPSVPPAMFSKMSVNGDESYWVAMETGTLLFRFFLPFLKSFLPLLVLLCPLLYILLH